MDRVTELAIGFLRGADPHGAEYSFEGKADEGDNFHCDPTWIRYLSIAPFDPTNEEHIHWCMDEVEEGGPLTAELLEEGMATHVVRLIQQCEGLELVDGEQIYLRINEESGTVEMLWQVWDGNQPSYYGGDLDEGREWVSELSTIVYTQDENPF
jgi:hypothetical protein